MAVGDSAVATHLYHIAQEAISNAVKHGKARRVSVSLTSADGALTLTVWDDGAGLPAEPKSGGCGLRIMRHRARMIGASLALGSHQGAGTVVTCVLRHPEIDQGR